MSASNSVAEAVWSEIESTHTVRSIHCNSFAWRCIILRSIFNLNVVTDDQLAIFHFIFGKNFERATKLVDQRCVKKISGEPSGRCIYQVMGESQRKEEYFCFPESYCGCHSFFYDTVTRGEQLCCKHQLAARLSASLEKCVQVQVHDEELAVLLSEI